MRDASAALLNHLDGAATTTCRLLKITLNDQYDLDSSAITEFGLTSLDKNITYQGLKYYATNGFDPSVIASNLGLSVDNAECQVLTATVPGITKEMIKAGILDDATWIMYLINWADLTQGHMIIDAGDLGEVRLVDDDVFIPELLSIVMRLRQPIGNVWQKTCRAIFATAADSQTGCGVDDTALWQSGSVTGQDVDDSAGEAEAHRVFADNTFTGSAELDSIVPGRVQWLTGKNASSRLYQVESYDSATGTIALMEPAPYEIEIGDTFQIRPDCNKSVASCKAYSNFANYKGEPFIPVADGTEATTPYSQI